ncbi:MAG: O-antigen ligase family protein [Solirubrobacterales bacterium]
MAPLPSPARRTLLAVAGLGCGASPVFNGYFDMSVWGLIAIALAAIVLGLLVARPAIPTGLAAVAVVALLLFAAWSLLSMGWAESADRALTEGDRWLLYAIFLLVIVLLMADRRDGEVFVFSVALAVLCMAGYEIVKMLGSDGPSLFGGSRLLQPLGYVNGMGGFFLLGFWPLVAIAERARAAPLAGFAAGAATLLGALVLLTDSRGTAFAFAASALVLLVLLPGRNRRAWLVLLILAALALAWGPLTDVTQVPVHLAPPTTTVERAAKWSLAVAGLVAVIWTLASWAVARLRERFTAFGASLSRISMALLVGIALAGAVAAAVAVKNPSHDISEQYEAFTSLKKVESGVRFTSGGGNRYDYWRIAWNQFLDHPLDGVGAGNFDRTYYLERRTDEDVQQAHSIELQTLGETGLVGALLLAAFFVVVFVGLWRRSRAAQRGGSGAEATLTVAAGGMLIVWLAQTSVDWLHLIPGLTGAALGAAAVLMLLPADTGHTGRRFRPLAPLAFIVVLILAVGAIVLIGRPTVAEHLRSEAQGQLETQPRLALATAEESLSLNPESVQGHYLEAASLAKLGLYGPARAALIKAVALEPHNYVSWALLGDLTTRHGDIAPAMNAYRRAFQLNPRDRELQLLGTRRALVLRLNREPRSVIALPETGG